MCVCVRERERERERDRARTHTHERVSLINNPVFPRVRGVQGKGKAGRDSASVVSRDTRPAPFLSSLAFMRAREIRIEGSIQCLVSVS